MIAIKTSSWQLKQTEKKNRQIDINLLLIWLVQMKYFFCLFFWSYLFSFHMYIFLFIFYHDQSANWKSIMIWYTLFRNLSRAFSLLLSLDLSFYLYLCLSQLVLFLFLLTKSILLWWYIFRNYNSILHFLNALSN